MRLRLVKNSNVMLEIPVHTDREFFKFVFDFQNKFSGTAKCLLFDGKHIIHNIKLGVKPCRVYNSAEERWYDFDYFYKNPFSFAFIDRLKYAYWIKDKILTDILFS